MLKKLILKNFKSFGDLEFDLTSSSNKIKKLIAIYGENGSGKSNLISALSFLKTSINTLNIQSKIKYVLDQEKYNHLYINESFLKDIVMASSLTLQDEIKKAKMIGSKSNMELTFIFLFKNKEATYKLVCDDDKLIEETLSYPIEKNKVEMFNIKENNIIFNNHLFKTDSYKQIITNKTNQYFGKHSFLSIIYDEIMQNNEEFNKNNICKALRDVISEIKSLVVFEKDINKISTFIDIPIFKNKNIADDFIKNTKSNVKYLNNLSNSLNSFFVSLYSDIKEVKYEYKKVIDDISYKLYFYKLINGEIRKIPYNLESAGTLKLLKLFPSIMVCMQGGSVFIDEIDTGIHDILMSYLAKNLTDQINKGQIVFTTHNTLLQSDIKAENVYVLSSDINGNKTINCVKNAERIQKNHNITQRYIKGLYGGVPTPGYINFNEISDMVKVN